MPVNADRYDEIVAEGVDRELIRKKARDAASTWTGAAKVELAPGDMTEYRFVVTTEMGSFILVMLNCGEQRLVFGAQAPADPAVMDQQGWHSWTARVIAMFANDFTEAMS